MVTLIREFGSPDEEMKKIVLKVVKQCVSTEGVDADYVRKEILPEFFRNFWSALCHPGYSISFTSQLFPPLPQDSSHGTGSPQLQASGGDDC